MLSVLEITSFHPLSQKRGLVCLFSIASVQTCRIEQLVCRNHVFAEFFKQASVKASRFDVLIIKPADKFDLAIILLFLPTFRPPIQVGFLRATFLNHI